MESYEFAKSVALDFIHKFAQETEFFTGGDILEAFRASGLPGADLDWRNRWGALVQKGQKKHWFIRSGKAVPTSRQSHTDSLTLWRSKLFYGDQTLTPKEEAADLHKEIRRKLLCREMSVDDALWAMYNRGWMDRGNSPS